MRKSSKFLRPHSSGVVSGLHTCYILVMIMYTYTSGAPTAQISLQFWLHHTAHCAEKIVPECLLACRFCVSIKGETEGVWGHLQGAVHTGRKNSLDCNHPVADLKL